MRFRRARSTAPKEGVTSPAPARPKAGDARFYQPNVRFRDGRRPAAQRRAQRPAQRARPPARRQVDLASRLHLRPAQPRRNHDRGPARRRRRAAHGRGLPRARRSRRAGRRGALARRRPRRRRDSRAARYARLRQRRHWLAADDGGDRRPRNPGDLRRRRVAAQAADAARARSAAVDGRAGDQGGGGRALPDHAARRARSGADPLPHAGRLGADQIGGAACGLERARPHHRRRKRGLARPYRENARPFRRRSRDRAGGRGPADHPDRPP